MSLTDQPTITVAFILSTRHAGSTWLNLVLGSHDWAMNVGEYARPFDNRDHVACRLCEANGLPQCILLGGIKQVAVPDAFHFAAERSGKSVIIDATKRASWCAQFLGRPDIQPRLVHLVRHPGGCMESMVRRDPDLTYPAALAQWEAENRAFDDFIATSGARGVKVVYETLADHPHAAFPDLCRFLGGNWTEEALSYWNTDHHGLGGNGAASVYLKDRKVKNYITGEDAFYAEIDRRPLVADRRWLTRLSPEVLASIARNAYFQHLSRTLQPPGWVGLN